MTDRQLVEGFLRQYRSEQTRLAYRRDLTHLLATLGGRSLRQLSADDLSAFASRCVLDKSIRRTATGGYSLASQQRRLDCIRAFARWLVQRGLCSITEAELAGATFVDRGEYNRQRRARRQQRASNAF